MRYGSFLMDFEDGVHPAVGVGLDVVVAGIDDPSPVDDELVAVFAGRKVYALLPDALLALPQARLIAHGPVVEIADKEDLAGVLELKLEVAEERRERRVL